MLNFAPGVGNVFGSTTATATLRANNYTHMADAKYNLYMNIESNPFVYSNTHGEAVDYDYKLAVDLPKPWCLQGFRFDAETGDSDIYTRCFETEQLCNDFYTHPYSFITTDATCTYVRDVSFIDALVMRNNKPYENNLDNYSIIWDVGEIIRILHENTYGTIKDGSTYYTT